MSPTKWSCKTLIDPQLRRVNPSKVFHYLFDEEVIMILAFIGGFIDAAGYILFDGLFTSSITGNMVAACASIYKPFGVLSRAMVCVGFGIGGVVSVAVTLKLKLRYHWKERHIGMVLFLIEIALLAVTMILGLLYEEQIALSLQNWHLILVSSIMGASMGAHNAAAKETVPNVPATTVMTMTLVTLANHFSQTLSFFLAKAQLWSLSPLTRDENAQEYEKYLESMQAKHIDFEQKMETTFRPMLLFLVGALVGTVITWNGTFWSMWMPMLLVAVLVADIYAGKLASEIRVEKKELNKIAHDLEVTEQQQVEFVTTRSAEQSEKDSSRDTSDTNSLISHAKV